MYEVLVLRLVVTLAGHLGNTRARKIPKCWAERGGGNTKGETEEGTPRLEEQALHAGADDCTAAHGRPVLE